MYQLLLAVLILDGILGGRQATTMLTRATWTTGGLFMLLSLVLSIMSSATQVPQSILRQDLAPAAPAAQPILPTLDQTGDAGAGAAEPDEAPPGDDGND